MHKIILTVMIINGVIVVFNHRIKDVVIKLIFREIGESLKER